MSKITNDGLTRSGTAQDALQLYPYGNSGHQMVNHRAQVTSAADLHVQYADTVLAAFMRCCNIGHLRHDIFNAFIDAAMDGRIELDLPTIYQQLVAHHMFRKAYDLVRRPGFQLSAINDATCRVTPLGVTLIYALG